MSKDDPFVSVGVGSLCSTEDTLELTVLSELDDTTGSGSLTVLERVLAVLGRALAVLDPVIVLDVPVPLPVVLGLFEELEPPDVFAALEPADDCVTELSPEVTISETVTSQLETLGVLAEEALCVDAGCMICDISGVLYPTEFCELLSAVAVLTDDVTDVVCGAVPAVVSGTFGSALSEQPQSNAAQRIPDKASSQNRFFLKFT